MEYGTVLVSENNRVVATPMISDGLVYASLPATLSGILQRRFQSFPLRSPVKTPSFVLQEPTNFPTDYPNLMKKLQTLTAGLDDNEVARSLLSKVDPYNDLRNKVKETYQIPIVTNASLKFIELMRFVQNQGGSLCVKSMFDNAALPGAFVLAAKHLFETECEKPLDWIASSYVPKDPSYALEDSYDLLKNEKDRWIMDLPNEGDIDGDVRNPDVLLELAVRARERFPEGVELYTSDIGIESKGNHEVDTYDLNYGQIVLGLMTLSNGGTFIIKMFTAMTPFTVSLIYNIVPLFSKLYLTKPLTSRQANSETYLVGIGFKGIDTRMRDEMLLSLSHLSVNLQFSDMKYPDRDLDDIYNAENVLVGAYQCQMLRFIFYVSPSYTRYTSGAWNRLFKNLQSGWLESASLKRSSKPLEKKREAYVYPRTTRVLNEYKEVDTPSQEAISNVPFRTTSYSGASLPLLSSETEEKAKRITKKKKEEKKIARPIVNIAPTAVKMFSYNPEDIFPGESDELYKKRLAIYRKLVSSNIHPLVADSESRIQVNTENLDVGY